MEAVELGKQVIAQLAAGEVPNEDLVHLFISKVCTACAMLSHCIREAVAFSSIILISL